jgi:hypothetical protein
MRVLLPLLLLACSRPRDPAAAPTPAPAAAPTPAPAAAPTPAPAAAPTPAPAAAWDETRGTGTRTTAEPAPSTPAWCWRYVEDANHDSSPTCGDSQTSCEESRRIETDTTRPCVPVTEVWCVNAMGSRGGETVRACRITQPECENALTELRGSSLSTQTRAHWAARRCERRWVR